MAYTPLEEVKIVLGYPRGKWNTNIVKVANISDITSIVAVWEADSETSRNIYILRKHPGLALLQDEECGIETENDSMENSKALDDENLD